MHEVDESARQLETRAGARGPEKAASGRDRPSNGRAARWTAAMAVSRRLVGSIRASPHEVMHAMKYLTLKQASFGSGNRVGKTLRGVSLEVDQGKVVALVGHRGARRENCCSGGGSRERWTEARIEGKGGSR